MNSSFISQEDGSEKLPKSGTPEHKVCRKALHDQGYASSWLRNADDTLCWFILSQVVWDKIQGWINNEQWAEIFKHDELREELLAKRVLVRNSLNVCIPG